MFGSGSRLVPGYMMKGDAIAGRYRVDRVVGSGNCGFVVAARHVHTREKVALKVITNGPRPDVDAVARLEHPNLARIVETGTTEELHPFVATEWVDGLPLSDVLRQQGPMPVRVAAGIIVQACAGLARAHAVGAVHADLKPQNLFLTSAGVVKVLDFGMRLPLETEEGSAAWFASPAYLAPEQLREPTVDPRADVWGLGVILHEMLTGSLPFEAETIAGMFVAVAYAQPKPIEGVPPELAEIVRACLAKDARERVPSVTELARRLEPFVGATDSIPAPMAMTIDAPPPPIASADIIEPSPASRMKLALERSRAARRPLPLGSRPRAPRSPKEHLERGWLAARLMVATMMPEPHTPLEHDFQRRRWGAVGFVAAAALLGMVSLLSTRGSSAPAAELTDEEVAFDRPRDVGVGPFVPPSFALPGKDDTETSSDRATAPPPTLRWGPRTPSRRENAQAGPVRAAVPSRSNPYGFTHPSRLVDRRTRTGTVPTGGIASTRP